MLAVKDIRPAEMRDLLMRASFGHLGCSREGRPYVSPMHYAYDGKELYFFTTEEVQAQVMSDNSRVCLQVEEMTDASHWRSVSLVGRVERLTSPAEIGQALRQILKHKPSLQSAIETTQLDRTGRPVDLALYRIQPEIIDGRKTFGSNSSINLH